VTEGSSQAFQCCAAAALGEHTLLPDAMLSNRSHEQVLLNAGQNRDEIREREARLNDRDATSTLGREVGPERGNRDANGKYKKCRQQEHVRSATVRKRQHATEHQSRNGNPKDMNVKQRS